MRKELQAYMNRRGITQVELAKRVGMTRSRLSRYMTHKIELYPDEEVRVKALLETK